MDEDAKVFDNPDDLLENVSGMVDAYRGDLCDLLLNHFADWLRETQEIYCDRGEE